MSRMQTSGLSFERELHGLFAVAGFEHGNVRRKLLFENLAQVMALGHVVFGNQD
jgi:hypothetical protein